VAAAYPDRCRADVAGSAFFSFRKIFLKLGMLTPGTSCLPPFSFHLLDLLQLPELAGLDFRGLLPLPVVAGCLTG
jgi:hypothetical protein